VQFEIYSNFWNTIDRRFACWQDLDLNWDSVWVADSTAIFDTVSRGRFAAILSHVGFALQESHTDCYDEAVTFYTYPAPGVPLMIVTLGAYDYRFGACLTPLPDSSLLVYSVADDQPLGLVPGDMVLGYDRVPWNNLYEELLDARLPIRGIWGSCNSAFTHSLLGSAGFNWHLFDTIDVVKYDTGDTVHMPTDLLYGYSSMLLQSEQLPVPGVPDLSREHRWVTYTPSPGVGQQGRISMMLSRSSCLRANLSE